MKRVCLLMLAAGLLLGLGCTGRPAPVKPPDGVTNQDGGKGDGDPTEDEAPIEGNDDEMKRFQGLWAIVSENGRPVEGNKKKELHVFLPGFNLNLGDGTRGTTWNFAPVATGQGGKMDLIPMSGPKDKVTRALYAFDDGDRGLKLFLGVPGGRRPKGFNAQPKSGEMLLVLTKIRG